MSGVAAQAQQAPAAEQLEMGAQFKQNAAVLARYPDVNVKMTAPSFAKPSPELTSQEEMLQFLSDKVAGAPVATVLMLGKSQQGRDIPLVLLSKEGAKSLPEARALKRPVVWFIGQQHGDEPAGGEAMLALAHEIARGRLTSLLETVTVAIVPRANPDGAAARKRVSASGLDINRDHVLLTLEETRQIHAGMAALPPDVVFDHHEFSVANRYVEKFGGVQQADAMLLASTHPMIAPDVRAMSNDLFLKPVEQALAVHRLMPLVYVTTSYNVKDPLVSTGGAAPGIARNAMGLMGAVSYLVETRGIGIGLEAWQRRVATHFVIAEAVLNAVKTGGAPLFARLAAARQGVASSAEPLPVAFKLAEGPFEMPLVDPETGHDKPVRVTLRDSRQITVTGTRPRPAAYVVTADMDAVAERLRLNGVVSCRLSAPLETEAGVYAIPVPPKAANRESINPDQTVKVELGTARRTLPSGALYVPMTQATAGIIAAALEPDSPGSFVGVGLMPVVEGIAPIFRLGQAIPATGLSGSCGS